MKIKYTKFLGSLCFIVMILAVPVTSWAKDFLVKDQNEYKKAARKVGAGDTIILKNGVWENFQIKLAAKGKEGKPVTLRAETKGQVIITGKSNLRIAGEYIVVSGLVFKDGFSPSSEVLSFRKGKEELAYNSRMTEIVVDNFNKRRKFDQDYWVALYGKNNRFDHNHLSGKKNKGVTLAVRLDSPESQENHHRIDHNYFGPRPVFGSNGGETIRIGTSTYSLTNAYVTVENNYFDRCNGEVEVISNKSGGNTYRNNVFFESRGTLTMRHGNGNLIENNVFFGNGKDHTGGIRVINGDQTVRNNYMSGLTGYRFGGALVVMNGSLNPPINRYHQVKNAVIENNTLIYSDHVQLAAGADEERDAPPTNSTMKNNLFVAAEPKEIFTSFDDISGIKFTNNALINVTKAPYKEGFVNSKTDMVKADNGLYYPADPALASVGASRDLKPITRDEVGVTWYPKVDPEAVFDLVKSEAIAPGADTLVKALSNAAPGAVFELAAGDYTVSTPINLNNAVTLNAAADAENKVNISFTSYALFELSEGGSLKMSGLNISGKKSIKAKKMGNNLIGNSLIRTKSSMLGNYQLILDKCTISDLNSVPDFNFLTIHNSTVADKILITNSTFKNISGSVLPLDKEIEDKGVYNAEYITIRDSIFENIGLELMVVYRGGTDESTFGPHVNIHNSTIKNVGMAAENKSQSSMVLHGVQVTNLFTNTFNHSAVITINHTVGEPYTKIVGNTFEKTPFPIVKELVSVEIDTAEIRDNKQL